MNTTTRKPNRYATKCTYCHVAVAAGAGILVGKSTWHGGWLVSCGNHPQVDGSTPQPQPIQRPAVHAYYGYSWSTVLEQHEWFDGEPEITASARATWEQVNAGYMFCHRHGDILDGPTPHFLNGCRECDMEAAEAHRDRQEGAR